MKVFRGSVDELEGFDADFVVVEIERTDIEAVHLANALDKLNALTATPERVKKFRESVAFSIRGYDDDSRELFEIPEVRLFFQLITEQWPHWAWFINRESGLLGTLFSILCAANWVDSKDRSKGYFVAPRTVAVKLEDLIVRSDPLFAANGIPLSDKRESLTSAMEALGMSKSTD